MAPSPNRVPVLSVSQITHAIKAQLEHTFPEIWVKGEISNFRRQSSGHLYFSLKDAGAQISAVMFRGQATGLSRLPKDGDQVVVQGSLNVYEPRGNYQIVVRGLTLQGVGELLLKLEQLKHELRARGWFNAAIKKPLPTFPKTIGLVTSPTGAAIQDMLNVLGRRHSGLRLLVNPVKVQGAGAAEEIARAIDQMNRFSLCDVMIVGRGGGSIEDLWAFNEEVVAKAIFESQIPVISAVGHETDYSIADLVADIRAPTPSAAAEIVVAEKAQHTKHLQTLHQRLSQAMRHFAKQYRQRLDSLAKHPVLASPYPLLGPRMQKLDDMRQHLNLAIRRCFQDWRLKMRGVAQRKEALNPSAVLRQFRQKANAYRRELDRAILHNLAHRRQGVVRHFESMKHCWINGQRYRRERFNGEAIRQRMTTSLRRVIEDRRSRIQRLDQHLKAINPQHLLRKGYSILFSEKDGSVISSVRVLDREGAFRARLFDGEVSANVKEVSHRDTTKTVAEPTSRHPV